MCVDGLACVIVKEGESEWFGINSGVRQCCIVSHRLFNVYKDAVMEGRDWRLPGSLYADDLVLCDESEEDLRVMVC